MLPNLRTNNYKRSLRIKAAAELERRRRLSGKPIPFLEFVGNVNPRYKWYDYNRQLSDVLELVCTGDIKRLMVFMPPRHGKSELVSRLFSAYYLYRHPTKWVGINSYAAELAYTFSRNARDNYTRNGGRVKDDAGAVKHWETEQGGGLWAAGVGGPITGKGFHLGIIDDPIKNAEEAASIAIRAKQKDWYDSTFYTREEPDGAIVVIQTRWHEDDLSGYLLAKEAEQPEGWNIVHFEAIKGAAPQYPGTVNVLPDNRQSGEALSERYPLDKLENIRRNIGTYFFGALYQQQPKPREGNMFKRAWFDIVDKIPLDEDQTPHFVRYWDKAGTEGGGAETAGVLMAECEGVYYITDVIHGQWGSAEREKTIKRTAQLDGTAVRVWVEQEPGSGGKESAEATIKNLAGYTVRADRPTGAKELRAEPLAAQAEAGNVKLLNREWTRYYLEQLTAFPNGKFKDLVDATSGAFNKLAIAPKIVTTDNPFY